MRKLASIRRIADIQPIKDADAIEVATIDGWKVVVKKGEYSVGNLVVYLEIDSWVEANVTNLAQARTLFKKILKGQRNILRFLSRQEIQ